MFNFADFIITGLIKSYNEGSLGEGQVYMAASDWFEKRRIDEEDMSRLMTAIEKIKIKKEEERIKQEEYLESIED